MSDSAGARKYPWVELCAAMQRGEEWAVDEFLYAGGFGTEADRQMFDELLSTSGGEHREQWEEKVAHCVAEVCIFASATEEGELRAAQDAETAAVVAQTLQQFGVPKNPASHYAKKHREPKTEHHRPRDPEEYRALILRTVHILASEPEPKINITRAVRLALKLLKKTLGVVPPRKTQETQNELNEGNIRKRYYRWLAEQRSSPKRSANAGH